MQKYCSICSNLIVNLSTTQQKRTRYCSEECGLIANAKQKINIEIDEKVSEGIYSNLAIINHSVSEFVIDFISIMPGTPKNKVKSRIIITPQHAKKLSNALKHSPLEIIDFTLLTKSPENPYNPEVLIIA